MPDAVTALRERYKETYGEDIRERNPGIEWGGCAECLYSETDDRHTSTEHERQNLRRRGQGAVILIATGPTVAGVLA